MQLENPTDGQPGGGLLESYSPAEPPNPKRGIDRIQTLWKVFFFLLVAAYFGPGVVTLLGVTVLGPVREAVSPGFLLFLEVGDFAILLGLTAILSLVEGRPIGEYGLPLKDAFAGKFWTGWLLGLAEASVMIGLILILGGYSFGSWELRGTGVLGWGLLHLILFLFVGLYEEFLFRGYVQSTLSRMMGFWPAAILLSLGFGLVHLENRGENWVGAAGVALVGLLFAFTLRRSGNLWYAVGLHAGFDWGETFLYSVPNSGQILAGHLSHAVLRGPKWLTGGTVGPEGSVFCFLTMGLQFLVVMWLFPKTARNRGEETTAAAD